MFLQTFNVSQVLANDFCEYRTTRPKQHRMWLALWFLRYLVIFRKEGQNPFSDDFSFFI